MGGSVTITIGMPVKNGEKHIAAALDSFRRQTYKGWRLIISDNASTDQTGSICRDYCKRDDRIGYIQQPVDLGPIGNFSFLLSKAETDFFVWAASDDIWNEEFLSAAISAFSRHPEAGLFFCGIRNIDGNGRSIRDYPSFARFVDEDPYVVLANYLLDPEIMGKANLWYGVIRLGALKAYVMDFLFSKVAGNKASDCAMILGVLCREKLVIDDRVLFHKRLSADEFARGRSVRDSIGMVEGYGWCEQYRKALEYACRGTKYENFVLNIIQFREKLDRDVRKTRIDSLPKLLRFLVRLSYGYARSIAGRIRH